MQLLKKNYEIILDVTFCNDSSSNACQIHMMWNILCFAFLFECVSQETSLLVSVFYIYFVKASS